MSSRLVLGCLLCLLFLMDSSSAKPVLITLNTVPTGAEVFLQTSSSKDKGLFLGRSDKKLVIEDRYLAGRASLDLLIQKEGFHPVAYNLKVLAITDGAELPLDEPLRLPGKKKSGNTTTLAFLGMSLIAVAAALKDKRTQGVEAPVEEEVDHKSFDPLIGRDVCGFQLLEPIDKGGMGTIYKARGSQGDSGLAAVKILDLAGCDEAARRRYLRELAVAAKLHHPAIVQTWDYALLEERYLAIVMELLEGQPLNRSVTPATLDARRLLELLSPIFDGLHYLHERGITHRDVKPQNIFLTHRHGAKLIDFGLARDEVHDPLTRTGVVMGTLRYLAPEQLTAKRVAPVADQYSLGLVIYEFLTGESAFELKQTQMAGRSEPVLAVASSPSVGEAFSVALARMYDPSPDKRYSDLLAARAALLEALG